LSGGCEQKFDTSVLPNPGAPKPLGDTNYVEILPPFPGFEEPEQVMVGRDQLLYITDPGSNELVMMDAGGRILYRRHFLHPHAIAQNSKLDLYLSAETIAPNGVDTLGAIFRIYLVRFDTTYISRYDTTINTGTGDTTITPVVRDTSTFYYHDLVNAPARVVWQDPARPNRRYTGIGMFPEDDYLVTRAGPDNSSVYDPDCRIMYFSRTDVFITPLTDLATRPSGGNGITDIRNLTGVLTFPSSRDFIVIQNHEGIAYGAIWMIYSSTNDFQGWVPRFDPSNPDQRGIDFIVPGRFVNPTGIAYDKRRREIFIVDNQLDSVTKFDRNGFFRTESFGKVKARIPEFRDLTSPSGVAFSSDCTLYLADTGNKVIRRFRISTQTICN